MIIYYLAFISIMSVITFIMYYVDKERALNGERRISEKTLLLTSVFGGAIGGFTAMQIFRHKTRHWYFTLTNVLAIVLHVALAIIIAVYLP